jgi:hypothetical protein
MFKVELILADCLIVIRLNNRRTSRYPIASADHPPLENTGGAELLGLETIGTTGTSETIGTGSI